MGNPAGVRRDFEELEQRRLQAAQLLREGVHQAEVARQVGVHRKRRGKHSIDKCGLYLATDAERPRRLG
jgi:hypothetical protein